MDDALKSAVVKLEHKLLTKDNPEPTRLETSPEEAYKQLYPMLEIWDADREDEDFQNKTKFIHEFLSEQGNPRDILLNIFTSLGSTPPTDTKVARIYKYCRLRNEANKALKKYETIQRDIHAISSPR